MTAPATIPAGPLDALIARRRTFAIISHPDAGKTTLTEKLLLYGGAIHQAGAVKARKSQRHATSDWMALEQERGISVTSSVLQFEYHGYQVNLLDTPGHQDFGEDTYRVLIAADSAVMLLDNRKGVEERTRQLFDVCRRRRMPIFTVVNKCDRVGEDPLKLVSDLEHELGITAVAAHWPIHQDTAEQGTVFVGVYDRRRKRAFLFERGTHHGAKRVETETLDLSGPDDHALVEALGGDETAVAAVAKLAHDIELLDMAGHEFDAEAILAGEQTPVYFASAITNFGVEPFLEDFLPLAPSPVARESSAGPVAPGLSAFTGFVFKVQANMDPRHRDRIAFVRVCSGRYAAGLEVMHVRTGKSFKLAPPQHVAKHPRKIAGLAAAEAAAFQQHDILADLADDEMIEADLAELADDHQRIGKGVGFQQMADQGCLAAAEEAGDDGDRYLGFSEQGEIAEVGKRQVSTHVASQKVSGASVMVRQAPIFGESSVRPLVRRASSSFAVAMTSGAAMRSRAARARASDTINGPA